MSRFDRKHYFYHDQPAGYQITQYYEPLAKNGCLALGPDDGVEEQDIAIKQIQIEQDTGKSQESDGMHLIDFNRAGHPLIEIISLPQIHSPEAASAYVKKVQALLLSVNAVTAGMEQGGLRADVNVSISRKDGSAGNHSYSGISGLGQRTEIKNLSTIKAVEDAIKAEKARQISVLEAGGVVDGETRGWSLARPNETRRLRGKEGEVDYRYMPDPDVPPLYVNDDLVNFVKNTLPALPDQLLGSLTSDPKYKLSSTDAKILLQSDAGDRLDFYQETVDLLQKYHRSNAKLGRVVANWILQETGHMLTTKNITWEDSRLIPNNLASLLDVLLKRNVTGGSAKQILGLLIDGDERSVGQIVEEEGLRLVQLAEHDYVRLAEEVVASHSVVVEEIEKRGKMGKLMFLVGQMIRRGPEGRVEAKKAEETLRQLIQLPPQHRE
ncbi:putative mitochondrial cytochrome c oxidase assembly factor [Phaeomoniella chlamydospora]|uniref:Putative mitochondrial cytochrome c oxidase assembly factor n=1 Tax=Phaeomoniella chlamydospora TaxID=158046 RepID=A0A0G2DX75_PHACM|nr:putative mitochondrial cytochrome c oxidase assembly factor [Phaeomoniella chlamydospora]